MPIILTPEEKKASRARRKAQLKEYYRRNFALAEGEPNSNSLDSCINQMAIRTQDEVAEILGISRQAVHQAERKAFKKIRAALLKICPNLQEN